MDYNARILAHKYAKALCSSFFFMMSFEEYTKLHLFYQTLCVNKALLAMMSAWLFDKATKQRYCAWIAHHYAVSNSALPIMELLLAHERIIILPILLQMCLQMYEDYYALERFEIISTLPLSDSDYSAIEHFLSLRVDKKIISRRTINNDDLIAGIIIKSMTHYLDYSITKKLRSVRHMLLTQGITWK